MNPRLAMVGALAVAACGAPEPVVGLEPNAFDVRIVVTRSGRDARVAALAGSAPFRRILAPSDGPMDVWVLGYTLEDLRREYPELSDSNATQIASALRPEVTESSTLDVPDPEDVFYGIIEPPFGGAVDYRRQPYDEYQRQVSEGEAPAFRLAPKRQMAPQAPFTWRSLQITSSGARYAVPMSDDSVLVGDFNQRAYLIRPDLSVTRLPLPRRLPSHAADSQDGRTVWFGNARLGRATVDAATASITDVFIAAERPPSNSEIFRLAVDGSSVYVLTRSGEFARYDSTGWTTLHTFDVINTYSGVVVVEPGHVVAAASSTNRVIRYKDGRVTSEPLPDPTSGISGLGMTNMGLVVGPAEQKTLYLHDGTSWARLPDSHTEVQPCAITSFAQGVFSVGHFGRAALYVPGRGVVFRGTISPLTQHYVAPLGPGRLLVAGDARDGTVILTVVETN